MDFPYDDAFRAEIARAGAGFERLPECVAHADLRRAAVAVTLVEAAETAGATALLLTRRPANLRRHASQWALPGGRCDPGESPVDTARRELAEELGLALDTGHVLGLLDDYPTRSGFLITPVVLWAGAHPPLAPDPTEVESVHRLRLAELARADAIEFFNIPESERTGVRLSVMGHKIYAPTAAVVYQFRELVAGRVTRVADFEQPVFAWR